MTQQMVPDQHYYTVVDILKQLWATAYHLVCCGYEAIMESSADMAAHLEKRECDRAYHDWPSSKRRYEVPDLPNICTIYMFFGSKG